MACSRAKSNPRVLGDLGQSMVPALEAWERVYPACDESRIVPSAETLGRDALLVSIW